jgi:hypothetical protein
MRQHLSIPTIDALHVGAAALALAVFGAAIAGGVWLGDRIGDWNAYRGLGIAAATLSITVFVSMAKEILAALKLAYAQLSEPTPLKVLEDAFKLLLMFVSLGFAAAVAEKEVRQLVLNVNDGTTVHPILLKTGMERPVAIFPTLFPNAELLKEYDDNPVPAEDVAGREIWRHGVELTDPQQATDIQAFIASLTRCADFVSADEPVVVQVQGFASSREFMWTDPTSKNEEPRTNSGALNLRATRDRANAVLSVLRGTSEFSRGLVRVRPEPIYATLTEMNNRRIYVDRIDGRMVEPTEQLARRAEIVVLYAPGCATAEITGQ